MIKKLVLAAALATIGTAAVADTYTAATPLTNQVEQHTFSHGAGYFFDTFNFTIGTRVPCRPRPSASTWRTCSASPA